MDRGALNRATESTQAPTPGYLYVDIAASASASPQICADIIAHLTRRLSKTNNPQIKYKCLKVLTKTTQSPATRGQFKRMLSQNHEAVGMVKSCLQFRGPPDAARGDEPYVKVREAARECLDAVYSDDPSSTAQGAMGGGGGGVGIAHGIGGIGGGGIGGSYGQPPIGGGGGGGGAGRSMGPPGSAPPGAHPSATRRMEGIGNPQYRDPRLDSGSGGSSAVDTVKAQIVEGFKGIINDPLARNVAASVSGAVGGVGGGGGSGGGSGMPGIGGGGGSYGGPSGSYGNPPGRSELTAATNGQWTMASNRGPNAVGAAPQFAHPTAAAGGATTGVSAANRGVGGSWGAGGATPTASGMTVAAMSRAEAHGGLAAVGGGPAAAAAVPAQQVPASTHAGTSASDGSYERNLIMELCPPGGMKAEPPPDKLAQFLRAVPSLDPDLVCPVLLDCLEDGQPWIIKAKALCVIERTITAADERGHSAYSDFFHTCVEEVQPLAVHNRAAIHNPARKVLKALGIEMAYSTGGGEVAAASARRTAGTASAAAPVVAEAPNLLDFDEPAAAAATAASAAAPPDMLGDFSAPAAPAPAPAAAPPAAAPPAAAPAADMFGGLTTKAPATAATAAPVAPAPPAPAPAADIFGDMTVKAVEAPKENGVAPEPAPAPSSGGSAFGFMNTSAANGTAAPAAAPAAPAPAPVSAPVLTPAPAAEAPKEEDANFDPLLSLSAPSEPTAAEKVAKTQAQIAQMQNMQYQQQMMMMQQQMAQMQMAMAGGAVPGAAGAKRPVVHQATGASAGVNPNVMSAHSSTTTTGFSFLDGAPGAAKEAQKKKNAAFDFVMDDMKKG